MDNLRQQKEDQALADKGEDYDRGGWNQSETGRFNRKICCKEDQESVS